MSADVESGLAAQITRSLKVRVVNYKPLSGGSVAQVYQVDLIDGTRIVAKQDRQARGQLSIEGQMLRYLAVNSHLPVPAVLYSHDDLLLLEYVVGSSRFNRQSQRHAAELLAELHEISSNHFGFEYDTLIGGLHQPNPWTESWLAFFRDQRLMGMGRAAMDVGKLPAGIYKRLERFAGHLDKWLVEPDRPSLIHGDAWTGNILADGDKIAAFVDPAIYFAGAEIELAFTTLFGTFGASFFERYQEIRPIQPGFQEERRAIYNLYPLLVHVRLFAGSYVESVSQSLASFGY